MINAHPAVKEAACVGIPDDTWGEIIHVVVAVREPVSEEDLIAFCRDGLARTKVPRSVAIWDELPKSPAAKILRREVKVIEIERLTGAK